MRALSAFSFFQLIYLYVTNCLALPLLNLTNISSYFNLNDTLLNVEPYHYRIPNSPLTLHVTLLPTKTPLIPHDTLMCLHSFMQVLALEPKSSYLDRMRKHYTSNMEAIISPVHCPGCALTYLQSAKVLAGLWIYISRENLLYVQRYGVFDIRTQRMVAWGSLVIVPPAPGTSVGVDMVNLPSGLAETS